MKLRIKITLTVPVEKNGEEEYSLVSQDWEKMKKNIMKVLDENKHERIDVIEEIS